MSSVHVDPAALHAAAGKIDGVAATFTGTGAPAVPVKSAQSTTAAVNAALVVTATAEKTIATRLRSTASAMSSGGTAFATTEHASTAAIAAVPDARSIWPPLPAARCCDFGDQAWDTEHLTAAARVEAPPPVGRRALRSRSPLVHAAGASGKAPRHRRPGTRTADGRRSAPPPEHLRTTSADARAGADALASARQRCCRGERSPRAGSSGRRPQRVLRRRRDTRFGSQARAGCTMAREIWQSARQLAVTDRRVRQIKSRPAVFRA